MSDKLKLSVISVAVGSTMAGMASIPDTVRAQGGPANVLLEEVVVTARRREESLQTVPISVVAFGGEDLEVRGLEQIEDLSARVPNISLIGGGATGDTTGSFVMRGVPGVGTYVDGVWQATTDGLLRSEFVELERVEVLRGPQGTLFGKNTTGGAINIVTARPANEFGARVKATVGSYDRRDITIGVDVPFTDTFRAKFTGASLSKDGFIHSTTIDRSYGDIDNQIIRGDFVWEPAETFDLRFIYETNDRNENGAARIQNAFLEDGPTVNQQISRSQYFTFAGVDLTNATAASGWPGGSLGQYETRSDLATDGTVVDQASATLDINWDITDQLSLRSITAHRTHVNRIYTDFDAVEVTLIEDDRNRNQRQTTQEFQLIGGSDRFSWVGGLYFWDEFNEERRFRQTFTEFREGELDFLPVLEAALALNNPGSFPSLVRGPGNSDEFAGTATDGWSIFGEVDISLTDALTLTVGLRHQEEDFEAFTKTPLDSVAQPGGFWFGSDAYFCPHPAPPPGLPDPLACTPNPNFEFGNFSPGQVYPSSLMFRGSIGQVATASLGPGQFPNLLGLQAALIPTDFESDTGRVSLSYQINDSIMVFGTYSEGFGAGGVSTSQVNIGGNPTIVTQPFNPEELENFELGFRSDLLDGQLRFNITYFSGEWTGIQVAETVEDLNCILGGGTPSTCPNLPNLLTFNAGAADVSGAEVEIIARPAPNFRLDANFGFLDTEYTDTGTSNDIQPGDVFQQAPDLTYSLGAQWNAPLSNGGEAAFRIDYAWTDDFVRSRERQRQTGQTDFGLINARFTYSPPSGDWRLAIFGTNLSDEAYLNSGFLSTGTTQDLATIGRPREVGASLEFFFD